MKVAPDIRLDALRGSAPRLRYNARSLAALENNPRCTLRAVLDTSGSDKAAIADHAGYPTPFGRSIFAITRGNSFEKMVKDNGCAELLRVLREVLELPIPQVGYRDLNDVGGDSSLSARYTKTESLLVAAARGKGNGHLYDHPLLRMEVGGHPVYLEPDLVAFKFGDRLYVVEIKSFPVVDGQADAALVKSATTQACAYILALRAMLTAAGIDDPDIVSDKIVLIGPKNFTNRPTGAFVDARNQVNNLARQLSRIGRIGDLLDLLPDGLTFDLSPDESGRPQRPRDELLAALDAVPASYRPDCLSHCEMAYFCRSRARAAGSLDVLGSIVTEPLGGIDTVTMALGLARGAIEPNDEQVEMAVALRHAARLRAELIGAVGNTSIGSSR
ncbi:hypothetical protein HLB23_29080 [Nocardia uniformis]|uniref:Secreted protein n=1 Tax=Nocardia uniformis TaxID=53432 RepID=A0A849CIP0_9NOCA|nr:hypothetical protein [Nocardia uniformis]NNH73861.1 hypothetical protein [Nocardia uniformis]